MCLPSHGPLLSLGMAASLAALLLVSGASAMDDRCLNEPTTWWWCHDRTAAEIDSIATANDARVVDIEVDVESPLRFAASFVQNAGPYSSGWFWFHDQTPTSLAGHVATTGARVVDIERYETIEGTRFAALLLVDPAGQEPDGWWYYFDQTESQVSSLITANDMRLTDIESHVVGVTTYHDVVGVQNTGDYAMAWWWFPGATAFALNSFATINNARISDMNAVSGGAATFDAILVDDTDANERVSWWYRGATDSTVTALCAQNGARIIDLETRYPSGLKKFDILLIGNLNELETWVADAFGYGTDGATGFYLKEVGGDVLAALQETYVFEPASTIKVVHHLHAMREVDLGHASLADTVQYTSTYSGYCPIWSPPWAYGALSDVATAMMVPSDNAATQGISERFGVANIESTASVVVGMEDTELNHTLGCDGEAVMNPNRLTLRDIGLLYESVADGSLLSAPMVETMRSLMINEDNPSPWDFTNDLHGVVIQETAALGIPHVADYYWNDVRLAWKPGGYDFSSPSWESHRSIAGWVSLPTCGAGPSTEYVFGIFIDKALSGPGTATARMRLFKELFRALINDALEQCPVSVDESLIVASTNLLQPVSPNPFTTTTDVLFGLPRAGAVRLSVYDVRGRSVAQLIDGRRPPGAHRVSWDGRASNGAPVPAGVYFIRLVTDRGAESRKVTRLQ